MNILYDAFEYHMVGEYEDVQEGETYCEQINNPDMDLLDNRLRKVFWSVYGHNVEGGLTCISDLDKKEDAETLCHFLNHILVKAGYGHEAIKEVFNHV